MNPLGEHRLQRQPDSNDNGSVRAPASQDRLSWGDAANPGARGLQESQHRHDPPEEEESASVGGNMLVVAGAEAEDVAQFIVSAAEPGS